MGMLEVRENSRRIVHYYYDETGKRRFIKHTVNMGTMGTELGTKLNKTSFFSENGSGRSLAWTRTSACHAGDPGSNPGGRIANIIMGVVLA